ncbi:MAG: 4-hydroxy-tetrahydrodipicolinate reductase [Candidatus Kapabacteria bacterium]|nr:4-hydroxy-tetrahydrodipicolinate reductase [Ignavibacteriota bacterium]MCW5884614.1 4-hydroxy-tetrahydrodipicolinate reductase [Candidatus Kapabacteria bacterium]
MNENIKIALIGYGNMGKEIKKIALSQNIEVTDIFDEYTLPAHKEDYKFDVAIDFSVPPAVIDNAKVIAESGKNLVIGTTGWYKNADIIREIALKNNTGIVWGANFSVGMQIFFKIAELGAKLINDTGDYDVFMHEIHHSRKKDSPSGTAVTLAEKLLTIIDSKKEILTETANFDILQEQLHVTSTRGGEVPGTHTVYFDSLADTIELTHRARNRSGFASGAITAAKLIKNKKGFYSFEQLLDELWK